MSSLLERLNKAKSTLQTVSTRVRSIDGSELVETRNTNGSFSPLPSTSRPQRAYYGFVVDYSPDLNIGEVTPYLLLSGQDVALDKNLLEKHKITHILNLATGVACAFPETFIYQHIDLLDLPTVDIRKHFDTCFEFIRGARRSPARVLVHCNAGVSRSATIVIAYLMSEYRLSLAEAFAKVKDVRPVVRPNEGFMAQLKEFERELVIHQEDGQERQQ